MPLTMLALSSQAGWFRERVAGPRDCCADTGRSNQLTRQNGEHLVTAELGRRGFIGLPFAAMCQVSIVSWQTRRAFAIPVQVKTIHGPAWQFNATKLLDIGIKNGIKKSYVANARCILTLSAFWLSFVALERMSSTHYNSRICRPLLR